MVKAADRHPGLVNHHQGEAGRERGQANVYKALPDIDTVHFGGTVKAVWFVQLRDRSKSMEQRLNDFYREYYDTVLTRSWMRLFLYASLDEVEMALTYL